MNKQLKGVAEKVNALSVRERVIIFVTLVVLMVFVWWSYYTQPLLDKTKALSQQNQTLAAEIQVLDATTVSVQRRINEGVHKTQQQKLSLLKQELQKVNDELRQKTLELIEPDEMFKLMQQLIFAESKLKLTGMKRKLVKPVFTQDIKEGDQPEIYQHVMQVSFEGRYRDVLSYISKLEGLEWKLIWDRITLKTTEYPVIRAEIDISTLSNNKYWVGL